MPINVIAFDADDTLWHNEGYFRETEEKLFELLSDFIPPHSAQKEFFKIEMENMPLYGYGIKPFTLSMVEAAIHISGGTIPASVLQKIIDLGKELLQKPVIPMEGVEETLTQLKGTHKLVCATKGDLLDQERKLVKSGLASYFHHIEIMSDKKEVDYTKLIRRLDIQPANFLMIGNSLKSDILPVLSLGGFGVHVPYHVTWAHEHVDVTVENLRFAAADSIRELPQLVIDFDSSSR